MLKNLKKVFYTAGCLVLTVLLLCGCDRESDLEITMQAEEIGTGTSEAENEQETEIKETESTEKAQEMIYVQVTGAVQIPGVYGLPTGSRVFEAVQKAGGMTGEAAPDSINQAVEVHDGDMIVLLTQEEWSRNQENSRAEELSDTGLSDDRVNINTATEEQLCTIPGIGETRARSIITYREQNGLFATIEEIKNVSGIKEGLFQKIKEKIKV